MVPYYSYSMSYPQTLFDFLRPLHYAFGPFLNISLGGPKGLLFANVVPRL